MDESTSENENDSIDAECTVFQLGAEEIIAHHSVIKQEAGGKSKRDADGLKSAPEKSHQSVKVGKKRGRKSRFPLVKCTHNQNAGHFTKSMVENALRENSIAIVLNHVSAYSPIWSFCGFPELNGQVCTSWVVCTLCRAVFSFVNATTSGAKRHVIMKHVPKSESVEDAALAARLERAQALNSMISSNAEEGEDTQENGELKDLTDSQVRIIFDDGYEKARTNCAGASKRGRTPRRRRQRPLTPATESSTSNSSQSPTRTGESTTGGAASGGIQSTRCSLCNVDFNNSALAMMHQSCHASSKRFDCAQCHAVFPNVFDFWAHLYTRDCETAKK